MNLNNEARGFRNNNPGNIRHGEPWLGLAEDQTDPDFCQFVSVEYGIRAIFKILEIYREKYHLTTIDDIISRWAPPTENDTRSYIDTIYRYMRWVQGVAIPRAQFPRLIDAILHQENSVQPFNIDFINRCKDAE
ncbi:hypothetical protein [Candidiatus Paracoxiella cheracis]|uniref:hypothetical protein n=1 Tax=Candidiatus Paracoxiella cheracis TaxID=3405120 RepID=UPI003BF49C85